MLRNEVKQQFTIANVFISLAWPDHFFSFLSDGWWKGRGVNSHVARPLLCDGWCERVTDQYPVFSLTNDAF